MPQQQPDYPACMAFTPNASNGYGYRPSLAAGIIFVIIFFFSSATHSFQAWHYKRPSMSLVAIGAGMETLGWIGRVVAHKCSYSAPMFSMQISLLIIAPAFTMAGIYIILFKMIPILGSHTSPFPPKICLSICLTVDIISLIMQAVGGGLVSSAFNMGDDLDPGTYTMASGIIFQLSATVTFAVLMTIVFYLGRREIGESIPMKRLSLAMVVAVACMVARGVYRSIELLEGWRGHLNTTEGYVIGLDAAIMALAVLILNVYHPGKLLQQAREEKVVGHAEMVPSNEIKGSGSESEVV